MASIAIMIGGAVLNAVLNAAATILRNTWQATVVRLRYPRKQGMTKHLKLIRRRWRNTLASARSFLTGLKPTEKSKLRRIKTSRTPIMRSSSTTRPTPTINYRWPQSRNSRTCICQVSCRNRASFFFRRRRASAWIRGFSYSLNIFCLKINGRQTRQNILQPSRLLERRLCNQKISICGKSAWKCFQTVAIQAGHLADLSSCAATRSSPEIWRPTPNSVHQADLLFLPHDKLPRKIYKYALTVVDIASRYKEAEPLASKNSDEVAKAFQSIYWRSPLTWPQMLQVDPGREFMGAVTKEMEKHKTYIRRGRTEIHRDQAIVERLNRTLAERLFGHQYAVEMLLPEGKRSTEWVKRLPDVVNALNNEVTSLIGKKPAVDIKEKEVYSKPSTKYNRPVGLAEKNFLLSSMWDICISRANLKAEPKEQQTRSGLWKSTRSLKIRPSQMSQLSIICLTGLSAALFAKSCWLCHLILSCRQPEMPVCPRLDSVFCYPALCIKRWYGDLVHAHSVHLVTLALQYFHLVHELLPFKERFFVVLVRYLLLNHIFFTPFDFLMFFSPSISTEYILGLTAITSFITSPPHSSFILPKTFLFLSS